ncbi:MAG: sigma-54-dependent Fis family transcriptional regulator [Candidatus Saccharicenans sp.]|jgi:DNA-binding NtrC family response regulator|nr:sigma-54-dependent Fis family transcriptional regulator [Candidatus Saccharicenans sp.]
MNDKTSRSTILIVDDDNSFLSALERVLRSDYEILKATTADNARKLFLYNPDCILLDIWLDPDNDQNREGLDLLAEFIKSRPDIPIIMISAYGDINTAVECMKSGATDFIKKPVDLKELRQRLQKALEKSDLIRQARQLEENLHQLEPTEIIGNSLQMQEVMKSIQMVAQDGHVTVLIRGETGTGKELVARTIHRLSWRSNKPFVPVHLASFSPNLVEDALFGHEPGAFTDARTRRIGFLEKAKGGIIFLDEIGDLPAEVQIKLLRFLENKTFSRLGSSNEIELDVQILSATNKNLEQAVAEGRFREDLYFRLKSFQIFLPRLREKREDIPLLVNYLLDLLKRQGRTRINMIDQEALQILKAYDWPGNVRELRAALERAIIYANFRDHKIIEVEDLPPEIISRAKPGSEIPSEKLQGSNEDKINLQEEATSASINLKQELARAELKLIEEALRRTGGKKTEAWKLLGLNDRFALRRRILDLMKDNPALIKEFPLISQAYARSIEK